MEREIKFRAWGKVNHKMYDRVEITYGAYDILTFTVGESYCYEEGHAHERGVEFDERISTNDMVLMQFTGLRDKNGKEIWEGDLLLNNDERWEVNYCDGAWHLRHSNGDNVHFLLNKNKHSEVIGNIYENPDLIHIST